MGSLRTRELQELIKTIWESGEISTRSRTEVGKAIEAIRKERMAARTMPSADISQSFGLLESSYEKSALGERWRPPWESMGSVLPESSTGRDVLSPRAFDINLNRGSLHAINELTPGGKYGGISARTKGVLLNKLKYRMALEESYAKVSPYNTGSADAIRRQIDELDESIYRMGATQWDERKGIPVEWMNTNRAYELPTSIEQLSGAFFAGNRIPGTLGSDLLSSRSPEKVLNKASVFTQKQWRDKESAQQELQFIRNYLTNPETAAEYAKTAPLSFFRYWSEKGGLLGLEEHLQSLNAAARAEEVELGAAKWGALMSVKDAKSKRFAFASLRGQVTELWEPASPKISQVGLFQDASGESIKFTIWKNQQQGIPKVEAGKSYYFGNVASQEWQGKWNLNINQYSAIEEIKPMPFSTAPPLTTPGLSVELRDYSKPYSIDPRKGTITYTTKSGKVVEMPIQKADMTTLKKTRLGDEPGDLAAVTPMFLNTSGISTSQITGEPNGAASWWDIFKGAPLPPDPNEVASKQLAQSFPEVSAKMAEMVSFIEEGFSVPGVGGPMAIKGAFSLIPKLGTLFGMVKKSPEGTAWAADALMAEYDVRPLSKYTKERLNELSSKPYAGLSWAEKSELDDLAFRDWSHSIGPPMEPAPLTQEDWLNIDRYNTGIQNAFNRKLYNPEAAAVPAEDAIIDKIASMKAVRGDIVDESSIRARLIENRRSEESIKRELDKKKFPWVETGAGIWAGAMAAGLMWGGDGGRSGGAGFGNTTGLGNTTGTSRSDTERFRVATSTRSSFQDRLKVWQRDEGKSIISGETKDLQTHELKGVLEGGELAPYNQVTITAEENLEQARAQIYRDNLKERQFMQSRRWSALGEQLTADRAAIAGRTLDARGKPINVAQKEEMMYNKQRGYNLRLYNMELSKLRNRILVLDKFRRDEIARGTPTDLKNAERTQAILDKYNLQYEALKLRRDTEGKKVFDLPEQRTDLSQFSPMDIGDYDRLAIRYGRGPDLTSQDKIKGTVNDTQLAADYSAAVGELAVVGLPGTVPKGTRAQVRLPDDEIYVRMRSLIQEEIEAYMSEGMEG